MKLTLKEMQGLLNGKCLPSDLIVGETLAEYLVRKFDELEQKLTDSQREFTASDSTADNLKMQLEKVVAENAGLKAKAAALVHEASEVYSAYNSTIKEPDGDFMDMQTLQEMQCVETPATDAYLAEVRAQESKRVYEGILDNPAVTDFESLVDWIEQNANDSVAFAAQLRKGVQS